MTRIGMVKTQSSDAQRMYVLLNSSVGDDVNQVKLDEEIAAFSKKIGKYPKKNRTIIKTIYDDISQYQLALYDDFDEMMSRYSDLDYLSFSKSDKTKELEQKLIEYGLGDFISFVNDRVWEPTVKTLKDKIGNLPVGQEADYINGLRDNVNFRKDATALIIKTVSKKIFE
jgi:hypothetical protein